MELLTHPFTVGLLLGLAFTLIYVISAWGRRRALIKDNRLLREHLHTQMTITSQGNQTLNEQITALQKQNENLRISLAALKNRPDRTELRTLYLYDKAIHLMYEKAPGFAPAWESVIKEAETEVEKTNTGLLAWVRKAVRPALPNSKSQQTSLAETVDSDVFFKSENIKSN